MADAEHLALIRRGVDEWNTWRKENQYKPVDLSQADLRKADLHRAVLYDADLSRANLLSADLTNTLIIRANLCGANLVGVNLNRSFLKVMAAPGGFPAGQRAT